jgi:hypothetical protein
METEMQGVQFVGIDVRDNDAAATAFERRYKITYPDITTAEGWASAAGVRFDASSQRHSQHLRR